MRLNKTLVATLAAAALLTGCSKSNEPEQPGANTQTVQVKLAQSSLIGKAEGSAVGTSPITLSAGHIYFVSAGGQITKYMKLVDTGTSDDTQVSITDLTGNPLGATITNVPDNSNRMIVVTNLPSTGITVPQASGLPISNLETALLEVNQMGKADGSVDNVPLYGEGPIVPGTLPTDNATATVTVYAVATRVEIAQVTATGKVDDYKLVGIFINSYYKNMELKGTPKNLVDNGSTEALYDDNSTAYPTGSFLYDYYTTAVNHTAKSITPPSGEEVWAYNLFPGDAPHIVLVLDELTIDGVALSGRRYVTVDKIKEVSSSVPTTTFVKGVAYKIGDLKFSEKNITDKPEVGTCDVEAEFVLMPWSTKDMEVDW